MKLKSLYLLLLFPCLTFISCNQPECENMNPILDQYEYDTKEYKDELAILINKADHEGLTYWLDNYNEKSGDEYIKVSIQGESICAKGEILVKDWDKIEEIKKTRGKGYHGAQLVGLTFDVQQDLKSTEFVYKSVDGIRD